MASRAEVFQQYDERYDVIRDAAGSAGANGVVCP